MRESLEGTLYITEFGRARISLDLFFASILESIASIHSTSGPHVEVGISYEYLVWPPFHVGPTLGDTAWYCRWMHDPRAGKQKKIWLLWHPWLIVFFCNIFTLHCCGSVIDLIKDRLRTDVGCISSPALLESFTPLRCIDWADLRLTSGIAIFEADFQTGDRWHAWTSRTLNKGSGRLEFHHGLLTLAYFSIIHASAHM